MQRFLHMPTRAALRLVWVALLALLAFAPLALCAPKAAATTVPTQISDEVTITTDVTLQGNGAVDSTGILVIADGGSLTLDMGWNLEIEMGQNPSETNPYGTGVVVVESGGTLIVTSGSTISSTGSVVVKDGGTLEMNGGVVESSVKLTIEAGGSYAVQSGLTITAQEDLSFSNEGADFTYTSGVLTVLSGKAMTIANTNGADTPTTDVIVVGSSGNLVSANLTLNGVNIAREDGVSPCSITSGSSVSLTLAVDSVNKLIHGAETGTNNPRTAAGITVPSGASLTIASAVPSGTQATGTLTAQGGASSDGIGLSYANRDDTSGSVTILGGVVTVIGGADNVTYPGGGIDCETITIKGDANVTVRVGNDTAIGSDSAIVLIEDSATVAVESSSNNGMNVAALTLQGDATLTMVGDSKIKGTNATIAGNASLQAPIVLDGELTISDNAVVTVQAAVDIAVLADVIEITDNAKVTAVGDFYGVCVRTEMTIAGSASVDATSGGGYPGIFVGSNAVLTIKGDATVTATGGFGGAGIYGAADSTIAIQENASVTATGGLGGAGIRAGYVNIEGGTVTATGGTGGAGIGGSVSGATFAADGAVINYIDESNVGVYPTANWFDENGTSAAGCVVCITGGVVTATATSGSITVWEIVYEGGGEVSCTEKTYENLQGEGIGNGYGGTDAGQFSTTAAGSAFIVAGSIADTSDSANWGGVIITPNQNDATAAYHASTNPGTGALYGGSSYTLSDDATIPAGYTLVLGSGQSLAVADGNTLNIAENGALVVNIGASYSGAVLAQTGGQLIVLKAPTPTPTPSSTPSATPTPSPSATPTPSPSATPSIGSVTVTTPAVEAEAAPTSPATGEYGVLAWLLHLWALR